MKKIALSALLATVVLSASDYNYEVSPMAGYLWNSTSNETNLNNGGAMGGVENHTVYGLEAQINNLSSVIKPELSVLYGRDRVTGASETTGVLTTMINGVYQLENISAVTPFVKGGVGYEWYTHTHPNDFNGLLLDAALGAKMDITKNVALKIEGLYMYKMNNSGIDGSNGEVHNIAALAGLTFKFGATETRAAPAAAPVVAAAKPEPKEPEPKPVAAEPVVVAAAPVDSDKDGVYDDADLCPNTPTCFTVDKDGCPIKATLHVNFAIDSNKIDSTGTSEVNGYSQFLKENPAYKVNIIGYTDSTGTEKHNQKLSERRAEAVKATLIEQGVAADRLTTMGEGEKFPVATNATKEGRLENRRIELELCH
ncbi:MAG: OmpA family protein [Sulfuricurvum sp.]|nr:OmpA family protein [Sulfuricurvum sp.]